MANMTQRSEEEIAHALAVLRSNGNNQKRTARDLNIPRSTLRAWQAASEGREWKGGKPKTVPAQVQERATVKLASVWGELAKGLTAKALEALPHIDAATLKPSGVRELLWGAGVATDKTQLLTGGPTSRTEQLRASLIEPDALRSKDLRVLEGGRKAVQNTG